MDIDLNINSINSQNINSENINNETASVKKQEEIAKADNVDFALKENEKSDKKEELKEYVKKQDFTHAIQSVNNYVEMFNTKVSFSIDEKSREIIHVFDNDSGELIRQIPPEEMIQLIDKLEEIAGIIFNNKV